MYRLLAGGECKVWLPKEEPFVIMRDMPPGYPSLLRPENTKNATPEAMERALDHLKSHLTGADIEWWTSFITKEIAKRETWENMTEEEYLKPGNPSTSAPYPSNLCPQTRKLTKMKRS